MRGRDSIYRIGGDKFVLIIEEYTDISSLISIANKIKNAVEEPFSTMQNFYPLASVSALQ